MFLTALSVQGCLYVFTVHMQFLRAKAELETATADSKLESNTLKSLDIKRWFKYDQKIIGYKVKQFLSS